MMQRQKMTFIHRAIDIEQRNRLRQTAQTPASPYPGLRIHYPGLIQHPQDAPDKHRIGIDAPGDMFGGQGLIRGLSQQRQDVGAYGKLTIIRRKTRTFLLSGTIIFTDRPACQGHRT
jgi:hypothetical protein